MHKSDAISVKAMLYLKTAKEGGRKFPIGNRYRPNHVFEIRDGKFFPHTFIGEIQFEDDQIQLGETKEVTVKFLQFGEIEQYLTIGRKWLIYEGGKHIGDAEIIAM